MKMYVVMKDGVPEAVSLHPGRALQLARDLSTPGHQATVLEVIPAHMAGYYYAKEVADKMKEGAE